MQIPLHLHVYWLQDGNEENIIPLNNFFLNAESGKKKQCTQPFPSTCYTNVLGINWRLQSLIFNNFKDVKSLSTVVIEFGLVESWFLEINWWLQSRKSNISEAQRLSNVEVIEFGLKSPRLSSWFHFSSDRLKGRSIAGYLKKFFFFFSFFEKDLKKFSNCISSFKHPATLTSSSHMKLKMMLGIDTRFFQSLKFNEARFIKCLTEEGSSVIEVLSKWRIHKLSIFLINSRILFIFEQPKRIRISRDSISILLGRQLRFLQPFRLRRVSFLWTAIAGWTSSRFIQPSSINFSRFGTPLKSRVAMRFMELFNLMDFKL